MRVLLTHADFIEFKPTVKELRSADEVEKKLYRYEELVVAFTAIEQGDENKIDQMINEIKTALSRIGVKKILVYPFAHLSNNLAKPGTAKELLQKFIEKLKNEGYEVYKAPFGWTKALHIKVKGHPLAEQLRTV